jgi:hypothetical protein
VERKGFPFRGSDKFKPIGVADVADFSKAFQSCMEEAKKGIVNLIVIESLTELSDMTLRYCQKMFKGHEIYGTYAKMMVTTLRDCKNDHATIVWTSIDQIVEVPQADGTLKVQRAMRVNGKELKGRLDAAFLLIFFTDVVKNAQGKMEYRFATNTDGVTTAKTSKDMFPEPFIPNDLAAALKRAEEYFKT